MGTNFWPNSIKWCYFGHHFPHWKIRIGFASLWLIICSVLSKQTRFNNVNFNWSKLSDCPFSQTIQFVHHLLLLLQFLSYLSHQSQWFKFPPITTNCPVFLLLSQIWNTSQFRHQIPNCPSQQSPNWPNCPFSNCICIPSRLGTNPTALTLRRQIGASQLLSSFFHPPPIARNQFHLVNFAIDQILGFIGLDFLLARPIRLVWLSSFKFIS